MTVLVEQGQCLMDIAIQHCGDATAMLEIARLNELSPTANVSPGTELILPEPLNKDVVNYFEAGGYVPATSEGGEGFELGGIGFMGISIDFIVS